MAIYLNIVQFQNDLLVWYEKSKRDLPWRRSKNPYYIWVSEIMLQQTRVDTVIPYFNRFIEQFPTLEAFADADEELYLKSWEGLGYYSRVRNLHSAVQDVVENYQCNVPNTVAEMRKLKGVGAYTAGAVTSIAYNVPAPAVDGNVMRVYARLFEIDADIAAPTSKNLFEVKVMETISTADPSSFNQGLMELGALICTPAKPRCLLCPVQTHCQAFQNGTESKLPIKTKKKQGKQVYIISVVIQNEFGELLIQKRPAKGLLAGLWEFPSIEVELELMQSSETVETVVADQINFNLFNVDQIAKFKHVFTHITWRIVGFTACCHHQGQTIVPNQVWVSEKELLQYALPIPFQKLYQHFQTNKNQN